MEDIRGFLERAAKRTGFQREYFLDKNMPTLTSNIMVLPLFGDIRTTCILSTFLLKRIKQANPSKYVILASWPGMRGLFPYVDEYWYPSDNSLVKTLASNADNFYNASDLIPEITRSFVEVFSEVWTFRDIKKYYYNGFEQKFWDEFKEVRRFFPEIPAENMISNISTQLQNRKGNKVLVYPVKKMRSWQHGVNEYLPMPREFWVHLVNRLIADDFIPVVYQNVFAYDLSPDFGEKCVYLATPSILDVICVIPLVGCVLDIFSGISRLAILARTPFLCSDERERYINHKDYEIDDLCCEFLPRRYIFSFSALLLTGTTKEWDMSLVDNIMVSLQRFVPGLGSNFYPTKESDEVVSYECVRKRESKRMGITFIGMSRENKE